MFRNLPQKVARRYFVYVACVGEAQAIEFTLSPFERLLVFALHICDIDLILFVDIFEGAADFRFCIEGGCAQLFRLFAAQLDLRDIEVFIPNESEGVVEFEGFLVKNLDSNLLIIANTAIKIKQMPIKTLIFVSVILLKLV